MPSKTKYLGARKSLLLLSTILILVITSIRSDWRWLQIGVTQSVALDKQPAVFAVALPAIAPTVGVRESVRSESMLTPPMQPTHALSGTIRLLGSTCLPPLIDSPPFATIMCLPETGQAPVPVDSIRNISTTVTPPTPKPVVHETCTTAIYVVKTGDSLSRIAQQFAISVAKLAVANNITDLSVIQIGQTLFIPCADPAGTTPSLASVPTATVAALTNPAVLTPTLNLTAARPSQLLLGHSTQGWPIEAYQFGNGPVRLALIGGIHGGYEWNTILLAYAAIDYFAEHPAEIPVSITLYIVPAANPDGQVLVVGHVGRFTVDQVAPDTKPGRFNSHQVDLNRNWDCNWNPTGLWGKQAVSGGSTPFSEVENQVLRKFLTEPPMQGVVFWHSAMPGVFPGGCHELYPQAMTLASVYAQAAGYPFAQTFTSYTVTGDATDWLSLQAIPAITVEFDNHTDLDWSQNLQGTLAILKLLATDAGIVEK